MMIVWQAQLQTAENGQNFNIIADWWKSLDTKSVLWKQRIIPESGEIDWEPQRFDTTFVCSEPDVRGITLYWKKEAEDQEKNITPVKMEFDSTRQQIYVYPENQENLVISVEVPDAVRETVRMKNPGWFSEQVCDDAGNVTGYRLRIHDATNLVEVRVEMDESSLNYLKSALNTL